MRLGSPNAAPHRRPCSLLVCDVRFLPFHTSAGLPGRFLARVFFSTPLYYILTSSPLPLQPPPLPHTSKTCVAGAVNCTDCSAHTVQRHFARRSPSSSRSDRVAGPPPPEKRNDLLLARVCLCASSAIRFDTVSRRLYQTSQFKVLTRQHSVVSANSGC